MEAKKLFGFLEHAFSFLIPVFLILFIGYKYLYFVYLTIISWFGVLLSHFIESKLEGKSNKKIIIGI